MYTDERQDDARTKQSISIPYVWSTYFLNLIFLILAMIMK